MSSIIEQLNNIYYKYRKVTIILPVDELTSYHERHLMNGNIITYIVNGELLGYIESWKISYEQLGRICCNLTLAHEEDLISGNICLITFMYITPDMRNAEVFLNLGKTLIDRNKNCTHFVAMQFPKKHKQIQVYSREEILKHYKI